MLNRLQNLRDEREGGFTLIELLIVIVILAVLAAIVVFSVTGVQNTSKTSACKTDVKSIDNAAEAYYAQKGSAASAMDDATHSATTLVGGGFLHTDSSISGNTKTGSGYTVTFTPGTGSGANAAGDAASTFC